MPSNEPAGVLKADRRGVVPLDAHGFRCASICRLCRLCLWKPEVEPQLLAQCQARGIFRHGAGELGSAAMSQRGDRKHRRRPDDERDRGHRASRAPTPSRRPRRQPAPPRGVEPRLGRPEARELWAGRRLPRRPGLAHRSAFAAARETRARWCPATLRRVASSWETSFARRPPCPPESPGCQGRRGHPRAPERDRRDTEIVSTSRSRELQQ